MANKSDYEVKPFESFVDFTGSDRRLYCFYHGVHDLRLEAKIMENLALGCTSKLNLRVAVANLDADDIASDHYDRKRGSLDIWYTAPDPNAIRIAILRMKTWEVPDSIREINVYDAKKK